MEWRPSANPWRRGFFDNTSEVFEIRGVHDMPRDPLLECVALARDGVPGLVEAVVSLVVTMRIGRESATRNAAYGSQSPIWQDAGVWPGFEIVHDLFHSGDGFFGGEHRFFLHPENTPEQDVSLAVGFLRVNDGDIGLDRGNGRQRFSGERALNEF